MTQTINLYDPELRRAQQPVSALQSGAALGLVVAGMLAVAGWTGFQVRGLARDAAALEVQLVAQREQVAALGKTISERKPDSVLAGELAAAEAKLATRREAIALLESGALGNTRGFADYLRGFSRQTVAGLWLTGFDIEGGGAEMAIHGRALEAGLLPRYVQRLNDEEVFRGRNFAALKMDAVEDKPTAAEAPAGKAVANGGASSARFIEFALSSAKATKTNPEAKP